MTRSISRRSALGLIGAGGATMALAGCGMRTGGGASVRTPSNPNPGGTSDSRLAEPEMLRSRDGVLEAVLTAAAGMVPWGSGERYGLTYNGAVPGPTLRVRPGDTLRVTLRNELDQTTNLHTHGLHVSPEGNGDNVFVMVRPGDSFTYEYRIPDDHPSGTFWYHPHHHGNVAPQVFGGLAGAIIVEDALDDIAELRSADQHILVLSDPRIGTKKSVLDATTADKQEGREGDVILVNGQLQPRIEANLGSVQYWRVINASSSRYYRLSIGQPSMYLIGTDQGRLEAPQQVSDVTLTPGQRAELLVPLSAPGRVVLSTTEVERGKNMSMDGGGMSMMGSSNSGASIGPTTPLLSVDVGTVPSGGGPLLPARLAGERAAPKRADRRRKIGFGSMAMGNGEFVVDGESYSAGRITADPVLGSTEDWVITNNSMMDHPFHLHVWPFRVIGRSGGQDLDPGWRDTVNIPMGESVTLRIPFEDFAGRSVLHCHILDHEDLGMMANVEVR